MKTEIICHDPKCEECSDDEFMRNAYEVDKLVIKKTTGESGIVHIDIIKKCKELDTKQKLIVEKAKEIYDKTIKDATESIEKIGELFDEAEELEKQKDDIDKQYPICKRLWDFNIDQRITSPKLEYHGTQICDIQEKLAEDLKHIYK